MRLSNSALTASRSSSSRARDGMVAVCVELLFYRAVLCCALQSNRSKCRPLSTSVVRVQMCLSDNKANCRARAKARAQSGGSSLLVHSRGAGQHQNSKFKSERGAPCHLPIRVIRKGILMKYNIGHKQVVITRNGHQPATTPEASQWGYSQRPRQDYQGTLSHGFSWSPRHSTSPPGASLSSPNA